MPERAQATAVMPERAKPATVMPEMAMPVTMKLVAGTRTETTVPVKAQLVR